MELPEFIEVQIRQFVDEQSLVEESKSPEELVYRGDERAGMILQKDYESLIMALLDNNQMGDASKLFLELKQKYSSVPRGNIYEKQVIFDVMQKCYDILTEHLHDQKQKEDILFRMSSSSNVFDTRVQPVEIKYNEIKDAVNDAVQKAMHENDAVPSEEIASPVKEAVKDISPKPEPTLPDSLVTEPKPDSIEPPLFPEIPEVPVEEVPPISLEPEKEERVEVFDGISKLLDDVQLFIDHGKVEHAKDTMMQAKHMLDGLDDALHLEADPLYHRFYLLKSLLEKKYQELHGQVVHSVEPSMSMKKYKQGLVYFFQGNYDRAADYFKSVLDEQRDYLPAKIRLAECVERSLWKS